MTKRDDYPEVSFAWARRKPGAASKERGDVDDLKERYQIAAEGCRTFRGLWIMRWRSGFAEPDPGTLHAPHRIFSGKC